MLVWPVLRQELKIGHVVIDSLMKCVRGDDYNGQKEFVDEPTALARDNQIHSPDPPTRKPGSKEPRAGPSTTSSGRSPDLVDADR